MKKTNKKATIYESLQGLIIFAVMLVAIILFFRGCSDGRLEGGDSLEEVKKAIERVNNANTGTIEIVQINIPEESMLIGYAPEHEAIITKYEDEQITGVKTGIHTELETKGNYTFPKENGALSGTLQEDNKANFQGYFKQRPNTCPLNAFCICECTNFELETLTGDSQIHKSLNAHINCAQEKCQIITDIETEPKIKIPEFYTQISKYQEKKGERARIYPRYNSFEWEGGFIITRTNNYEIGIITSSLCASVSQTTGRVTNTQERSGNCRAGEQTLLEKPLIIAGNIRTIPPFADLTIRKTADAVRFTITG